jgi:hypothetical protein
VPPKIRSACGRQCGSRGRSRCRPAIPSRRADPDESIQQEVTGSSPVPPTNELPAKPWFLDSSRVASRRTAGNKRGTSSWLGRYERESALGGRARHRFGQSELFGWVAGALTWTTPGRRLVIGGVGAGMRCGVRL